jgi:hypothetical protein
MTRPSARGDLDLLNQVALRFHTDEAERQAFVNRQIWEACVFVSDPVRWRQIECMAKQLRRLLELTYEHVRGWMEFVQCNYAGEQEVEDTDKH